MTDALAVRIVNNISVPGDIIAESCWLWSGTVRYDGYPQLSLHDHSQLAHRVAYQVANGPIPDGLEIDHLCRVRHCVNPKHLEAVTRLVNVHRSGANPGVNSRKTQCLLGHPLSGSNLGITRNGARKCMECRRGYNRKYRAKG